MMSLCSRRGRNLDLEQDADMTSLLTLIEKSKPCSIVTFDLKLSLHLPLNACWHKNAKQFLVRMKHSQLPTMKISERISLFLLLELYSMHIANFIQKSEGKKGSCKKNIAGEISGFPGCGTRPYYQKENEDDLAPGKCRKDKRVIGGKPAMKHSWPWMMALFKKPSSDMDVDIGCGASLISPRYALTAAHCVENADPEELWSLVGVHTAYDGEETPICSILMHPKYNAKTYDNDIALLRLKRKVILSREVRPVCLPPPDLQDTHLNMTTVTGWGMTSLGRKASEELQEVSVPVVPFEKCKISNEDITEYSLCAGNGKDACLGDSGGPLVAELAEDTWVQVGIVSYGHSCAVPGFPGVYTRVSKYVKWIQDNTDLTNL